MLDIGDIVVKNNVQLKVKEFFLDFDMITGDPYRVASLVDVNNVAVSDVAENVILQHYQINRIGDYKINKIMVAVMYDDVGEEFMEFIIKSKSDVMSIISDYNSTDEYSLSLYRIKTDYEYCVA
jgi:hypothetical protein